MRVSVVGAGLMGEGIAALHVAHDVPVTLFDSSPERLSAAIAGLDGERVTTARSLGELADCSLVIETVTENRRIKQQVYAALEAAIAADAIIATNTSTLPIGVLAERLQHPERFCGFHFCHPVDERPLVEIVPGARTSLATRDRLLAHAARISRRAIVVADSPAFAVNRILWPYLDEGLELLLDGVDVERIESIAMKFGMPTGPIGHLDEFGIDVALRSGSSLRRIYPDRVDVNFFMIHLYDARLWGLKTGQSLFANVAAGEPRRLSDEVREHLGRHRRDAPTPTDEEIRDRLFLRMIVESTRMLEESVIDRAELVDVALTHGLGFRGPHGLIAWGDSLGTREILRRVETLAPLGKRFAPSARLVELAAAGAMLR